MKGKYQAHIIGFMPNRLRGERINLGLVAFGPGQIKTRWDFSPERLMNAFGPEAVSDAEYLKKGISAVAERVQDSIRGTDQTPDVKSLVGDLKLSVDFSDPIALADMDAAFESLSQVLLSDSVAAPAVAPLTVEEGKDEFSGADRNGKPPLEIKEHHRSFGAWLPSLGVLAVAAAMFALFLKFRSPTEIVTEVRSVTLGSQLKVDPVKDGVSVLFPEHPDSRVDLYDDKGNHIEFFFVGHGMTSGPRAYLNRSDKPRWFEARWGTDTTGFALPGRTKQPPSQGSGTIRDFLMEVCGSYQVTVIAENYPTVGPAEWNLTKAPDAMQALKSVLGIPEDSISWDKQAKIMVVTGLKTIQPGDVLPR